MKINLVQKLLNLALLAKPEHFVGSWVPFQDSHCSCKLQPMRRTARRVHAMDKTGATTSFPLVHVLVLGSANTEYHSPRSIPCTICKCDMPLVSLKDLSQYWWTPVGCHDVSIRLQSGKSPSPTDAPQSCLHNLACDYASGISPRC